MSVNTGVIRACLLYEFKLGTKAAEASRKICTAFGDDAVSERTAQKWFKKFVSGDESLEDSPRSGRPSVIDNEELRAVIENDSKLTCQELSQMFSVSDETIRLHLHQLGKSWKLSKWVPHELSDEHRFHRVSVCSALLSRYKTEPFLDCLLTADEKWIMYNNTKRTHHWLSSNEPIPHSSKTPVHCQKIMLCVWWTAAGIIHYEFLPKGQTVTAELYSMQLDRVHQSLLQKQPGLVNRKRVIFLQDNARPHVAKVTLNKINVLGWELLPHPPYSPDMSPTDYHLFLALQNYMTNKKYQNQVEIEEQVANFFASKNKTFYEKGIYSLVSRWERIVECAGTYINE